MGVTFGHNGEVPANGHRLHCWHGVAEVYGNRADAVEAMVAYRDGGKVWPCKAEYCADDDVRNGGLFVGRNYTQEEPLEVHVSNLNARTILEGLGLLDADGELLGGTTLADMEARLAMADVTYDPGTDAVVSVRTELGMVDMPGAAAHAAGVDVSAVRGVQGARPAGYANGRYAEIRAVLAQGARYGATEVSWG